MLLLTVAATILGCGFFYLTLQHQQMLKRPMPSYPWRWLLAGYQLLCLAAFIAQLSGPAACFMWLTTCMCSGCVVPFLPMLKRVHIIGLK